MSIHKNIAHIDDDPDIINISRRVLEFSGYNITAVTSFKEIDHELWGDFDLLIVDWMVPETNAIEMYDNAREFGFKGDCLVLSARELYEKEREAIAERKMYHMRKPFGPSSLIDTITDIFARKA